MDTFRFVKHLYVPENFHRQELFWNCKVFIKKYFLLLSEAHDGSYLNSQLCETVVISGHCPEGFSSREFRFPVSCQKHLWDRL